MKHTHTRKLFRQGDVLLLKVDKLPAGLKHERTKGPIILAEGEATGHHHAIRNTKGVKLYRDTENRATFVEVAEALAALTHEEHAPIVLEPGVYEVRRQREYHPEEIRRVAD